MALLAVYEVAVYAVVPVKSLALSKRRLSSVFTPKERRRLTLAMLQDVLEALKSSNADEVSVVGEDSQVQQVAERFGVSYLRASKAGLNPAIEEATAWCLQQHASSVLVLPADIPLVSTKDINRILELGVDTSAVVLSPSQNWGTNALLRSPPRLIPACFGPKSFLRHIREAYRKGVSVRLHFSAGLSTDIDSVEDLKKLIETQNSTHSKRVLEQAGFNNAIR